MYIYKITNLINGKIYIGQTTRTLQQRWIEHCKPSSTNCVLLHNAIQKYGKENFIIEKIDMACDLEELNKKEIYWINYYDSANSDKGYNLSLGGGVMNISDVTRVKMSISHMGDKNNFYGKHHTELSRRKMSLLKRDKYIGDKNPRARKIRCVENNKVFNTSREASVKMNVNKSSLCLCLKGKNKTAGGYHWEYADNL